MKKIFTFVAALMLAFSASAVNVYFKLTPATSWWANDGAKIGAYFKVGPDELDEGAYAQFFTLVPGTTDTYVGVVPESEEDPYLYVQFLRYSSMATDPEDMNYWNATGLETWNGVNDMFTATGSGDTWDSTTGTWSKFAVGPTKDEKFSVDGNNFVVIGTDPMEVMVDTNSLASGALVIPDSVEYKDTKLAVTVITANAFKDNANITSVVVPGTIDSIGEKAFYNCAALKVAKLGEGIKKMGRRMFSETPLDTIYMPSTLGGFKDGLGNVMDIQAIKWYEVADGNSEVASIEGVLVNADKNTLLTYPHGRKATEYIVPAGITAIDAMAFADTTLVSINFSDVEVIGAAACGKAKNLTTVEFSDKLDSIADMAFGRVVNLSQITCAAVTPPSLGEDVFYDVTLSNITLYVPAESVAAYKAADTWKDMNVQAIPVTGVENVNDNDNHNCKFMHNGQLYIRRGDAIYDAKGQVVK